LIWPTLGIRIVRIYSTVCNLFLGLTGRLLYRHAPGPNARRILVVRFGYIGDLLVTIPALHYLRTTGQSAAKIALLTHPTSRSGGAMKSPAAELLRDWGFIDAIIYSPTRFDRSARDAIINFGADRVVFMPYTGTPFKSMLFQSIRLRLMGVRARPEGLHAHWMPAHFRTLRYKAGLNSHQAVTALDAVGAPSTNARRRRYPSIPVLHAARQAALAALAGAGERPLIVLGCSAKYWHRQWPIEYYRQVMDSVAAQYDAAWIILGAADDAELAAELERTTRAFTVNLCAKLSLGEAAEVARMSSLYLGNETGLAHLSAALGVPTVAVYSGIHSPGVWEPWSDLNVTLRAEVPCQGCGSERFCPTGDKRCLTSITPDLVIDTVKRMLSQRCHSPRMVERATDD
jgi:ADP-heptose:LPS heptosyltransferase